MKEALLHPFHKLKSWLESFANKPHALVALFSFGFIEASFFPLSPDVLLVALGVTKPRRAVYYSLLVVAGSTAGAFLGYYIGYALYESIGSGIVQFLGVESKFQSLLTEYRLNAWIALLFAGFTSIPFMVFTIAAGCNATVEPLTLLLAALCGRLIRFVPLGGLLYLFGPRVKSYFDRYFGRTILILGLVVIMMLIAAERFL